MHRGTASSNAGGLLATIGAILGGVGLLAFTATLAFVLGSALPNLAKAREIAMRVQATSEMVAVQQAIRNDVAKQEPSADGIDEAVVQRFTTPGTDELAATAANRLGVSLVDPWANPFRITLSSTKPASLIVRSDGPDGVPETADDLVVPDEGGIVDPDEPKSQSNGTTTVERSG